MRVIVVEQNSQGGLLHYAYLICTALAECGADVTLITAEDYELKDFPHNFALDNRLHLWQLFDPRSMGTPPSGILPKIWRKISWTLRRGLRAVRLVRMWIGLTNHLIQQQPDIVQFGKINFPFEAFFLARLRRHGLVLAQINHEFERRERQGLFARQFDRLYASIYDNFSAIFFHAQENKQRFLSIFDVPREITHVIPHGNLGLILSIAPKTSTAVKLHKRYGLQEGQPVVLFFGVIAPSKGLPDLIHAFASVALSSEAKLIIAGYPSKYIDLDDIHKQIDEFGIRTRVALDPRYLSNEELGALVELATVVVFPYHSGTQSGALQVAYAFGRPVVATSVGGLPEAVEDGKSGFLVPPHAPQALAERILTLVEDPLLAENMGACARQLSETRFSWKPIGTKVLGVYEQLLAGSTPTLPGGRSR